ncbi:MAG: DMT family transporter [Chloroflexota bacterium]
MNNPQPTNGNPQLAGLLLVLLAAALWGTLGTLYKFGTDTFGLTPLTIVFWRAALAGLVLALVLGIVMPLFGKGWSSLRVRRADLPIFITFGLLGVTAFYLLYIYAVVLVGVAVAVVLLYTAPAFVSVMSWRFLGESFGPRKMLALLLTLLGCALVARVYDPTLLRLNVVGILCGVGSAFTYALYSILGKLSLRRGYPIATMSFYVYTIGAIGLLLVALFGAGASGVEQLFSMGTDVGAWALLLLLAVAQTIGALYAYTAGLRHLEAGTASILATFEPLVAACLAYFLLHETLEWLQLVGGALILVAVMLLQSNRMSSGSVTLPVVEP